MARRWLTPDSLGALECRPAYHPAGEASLAALRGALLLLAQESNWEEYGSKTPAETAQAWLDALWEFDKGATCLYVGTVFWYAGTDNPPNCLACDGGYYQQAEYPKLFAVIGTLFGATGSDDFRVPAIEGRFISGADHVGSGGGYSLGHYGGADEVTLTLDEIPAHDHDVNSHSHTVHAHFTALAQLGAGSVVSTPNPVGGATGGDAPGTASQGGGQPHENRPPFVALRAFIVAE